MPCIKCFHSRRNYGECGEKIDHQNCPIAHNDLPKYRGVDKRDAFDDDDVPLCNSYTEVVHGKFHESDGNWGVIDDEGTHYPLDITIRVKPGKLNGVRTTVGVKNGLVVALLYI